MQYWDRVNNTTIWKDAISLIKTTHPKGVKFFIRDAKGASGP
jgi:hypothetical protein